jgi:glycosyltransferase involved in cell wall biosynthesis
VTAWHVAVVVENLPLGVDTRLRKQVDDLLAAGFAVTVVTMRHDDNEPYRHRERLTLREHTPPPQGRGVLGFGLEYAVAFAHAARGLLTLRLRRRVDVLQLCQPPDVYFPLAWVLRALGARVVVDQRDLVPEILASRGGRPPVLLDRLLRRMERESRRAAHEVVTVNERLAERLSGDGTPVRIARNGPVLARARRAAPDPGLRRDGEHLVVWAGKIGRQDRVDLVVRLAEEVVCRRHRTDCRFVILGDGECEQQLRDEVAALGLQDWVRFTGWVSEAEVFRHLASADLGVDTTLQHEVTPVKAMEYFATGLPLACFDLGETRRLADGVAVLVPPGDVPALATAVLDLLDDPGRRQLLGARARRLVEDELAWERQCVEYLRAVSPPVGTPVSATPVTEPARDTPARPSTAAPAQPTPR